MLADSLGKGGAAGQQQTPPASVLFPTGDRVAASIAHTPSRTARTVPVRRTVNPPAWSSATGSPNRVRIAGLRASAAKAAGSSASLR
ncbi:hypothetical protein DER29_6132 [Micromonospora sp. M71_S20]|nr:hypothetical protein DER29_6132 [Micromonospora sp. M71_S20]